MLKQGDNYDKEKRIYLTGSQYCFRYWNTHRFYEVSGYEKQSGSGTGSQIKQLGEAVNRYISIRYDKISTLSSSHNQSSDPGPRTCTAAGCEITYQTLINEGLLPTGYTGTNAQKSTYKILLKRSGTAPDYVINGLITTSSPWKEGGRIRYDLLGKAVQAAGVDGGMSRTTKIASGYGGQWSENSGNYSNITDVDCWLTAWAITLLCILFTCVVMEHCL